MFANLEIKIFNYENQQSITRIVKVTFNISITILVAAFLFYYLFFLPPKYTQPKQIVKEVQKNITFVDIKFSSFSKWEYIGDPKLRHQQYSAYFDPRIEAFGSFRSVDKYKYLYGYVRIFAVLPLKMNNSYMHCIYTYRDNKTDTIQANEVLPINEHFYMDYSAYSILCALYNINNKDQVNVPKYVSLSYTANPNTLKLTYNLKINYPPVEILFEPNDTLAVCVSPIQQNFSDTLRLVEFIEMYKLLGAKKFYLYRLSASNNINRVLNYYQKKNTAQIMNWNLYGYIFEDEVRYSGQLAEINDCVYRATFLDGFKYVAIVDLDEVLMPMKFNTLVDFLKKFENKRTSAFEFRNVFFHKIYKHDYCSAPKGIKNNFLFTQVIVERTAEPLESLVRSKYIVNARTAIELGIHQVWRSLSGYSETNITESDGLLYHYRSDCVPLISSCKENTITDYTARRYSSKIWIAVEDVCERIFVETNGVCPMK